MDKMSTPNSEYDYHLKILIIGNSGVGKSCMLMRYAENSFTNNFYNTIGVDFWDTAGQDKFKTITCSYYRGAHGIMIVYDITDRETFDQVKIWMQEIEKFAKEGVNKILIGNKCDQENLRKVSEEEGKQLAQYYKISFLETSAKNSCNVEQSFQKIATNVLDKLIQESPDDNKKKFKLKDGVEIPTEKKGCC